MRDKFRQGLRTKEMQAKFQLVRDKSNLSQVIRELSVCSDPYKAYELTTVLCAHDENLQCMVGYLDVAIRQLKDNLFEPCFPLIFAVLSNLTFSQAYLNSDLDETIDQALALLREQRGHCNVELIENIMLYLVNMCICNSGFMEMLINNSILEYYNAYIPVEALQESINYGIRPIIRFGCKSPYIAAILQYQIDRRLYTQELLQTIYYALDMGIELNSIKEYILTAPRSVIQLQIIDKLGLTIDLEPYLDNTDIQIRIAALRMSTQNISMNKLYELIIIDVLEVKHLALQLLTSIDGNRLRNMLQVGIECKDAQLIGGILDLMTLEELRNQ